MTGILNTFSSEMLPVLDRKLEACFTIADKKPEDYAGMMKYHMGWLDEKFSPADVSSGKKIRPLLCLLSCQAAGSGWERALSAAASIEILHNFTLAHDDIVDHSPTRRGRKTMWNLWGMEKALNAGDAMCAVSFHAMTGLASADVPPEIIVRCLKGLSETLVTLTEGQHLDMDFEERDSVSTDEYLGMISGKTAALISLSTGLGALIAEAPEETVKNLYDFGFSLGMAFQIQDDILGIWGEDSKTGKSTSTDIITRKKTLPVLYGFQKSKRIQKLYKKHDIGESFAADVLTELNNVSARKYAEEKAGQYSHRASDSLEKIKPSDDRARDALQSLHEIISLLLKRDH